jgi:hypothetical protein
MPSWTQLKRRSVAAMEQRGGHVVVLFASAGKSFDLLPSAIPISPLIPVWKSMKSTDAAANGSRTH